MMLIEYFLKKVLNFLFICTQNSPYNEILSMYFLGHMERLKFAEAYWVTSVGAEPTRGYFTLRLAH